MTKLTGLFPAISFVPAGMVVRMMFLPRLLIFVFRLPLTIGVVTTLLLFSGWLRTERGTVIRAGNFPVCVVTTVAGTCRTVAVAVPNVRGEHETPGATVIPLAPATTLAAMVTTLAHVDAVSGLPPVVVVIVMVWPCFCGITPRPGIIRMVAPLLSGEVTLEKVLVFWSATVTAKVGIRRMAVSPAAFSKVEVTGPALVVCTSPVQDVALEAEEGEECGGVTWRVADMLLLPEAAVPKKSGVSLTVATGDLARVAIMSGVIRSTVCPLASVVMEDGGRRRTSLPWMRKFVAVIGIPAPPAVFIPNWPVIDTCLMFGLVTPCSTAGEAGLLAGLPGDPA